MRARTRREKGGGERLLERKKRKRGPIRNRERVVKRWRRRRRPQKKCFPPRRMPVFHPLSLEGKLVQSEPIIHSSTKALRRQIELKKNGLASSFSETVFFEAWRAHKPYFPSHTSVTSCSTLVNSLSLHYRENRKKLPLLQQCAPNDLIHVMADEAAKGRQGKQTRGKKPKQSSKSGGSTKHKKGESKKRGANGYVNSDRDGDRERRTIVSKARLATSIMPFTTYNKQSAQRDV